MSTYFTRDDARVILKDLALECRRIAVASGWEDKDRDFAVDIALFHSEISEALEEYQKNPDVTKTYRSYQGGRDGSLEGPGKPEGVAAELADAIIRILHSAAQRNIPVVDEIFAKLTYNETRSYRHGGKTV
jgi:hypothetical protein